MTHLSRNNWYAPNENFVAIFALAERLPTSATLPMEVVTMGQPTTNFLRIRPFLSWWQTMNWTINQPGDPKAVTSEKTVFCNIYHAQTNIGFQSLTFKLKIQKTYFPPLGVRDGDLASPAPKNGALGPPPRSKYCSAGDNSMLKILPCWKYANVVDVEIPANSPLVPWDPDHICLMSHRLPPFSFRAALMKQECCLIWFLLTPFDMSATFEKRLSQCFAMM